MSALPELKKLQDDLYEKGYRFAFCVMHEDEGAYIAVRGDSESILWFIKEISSKYWEATEKPDLEGEFLHCVS